MPFRLLLAICLCAPSTFPASESEMQKLASVFSGRWRISDKSDPSPQHPSGLVRNGEEVWHTLAGGIPLIEEYHSKSLDGEDEYDTAAIWWNATDHKYVGVFCADFVDQGCAPFDVVWQTIDPQVSGGNRPSGTPEKQNQIIMSGEYLQSGTKYAWKETFVFSTPTVFTQTLFVGESGHELKRVAVISATKSGGAR
jgi:hypothetical protein